MCQETVRTIPRHYTVHNPEDHDLNLHRRKNLNLAVKIRSLGSVMYSLYTYTCESSVSDHQGQWGMQSRE
jgi:uncharacterized UBP type Zn finger protein